jgi:uncharacterized membrane protein HdeD (DUF308 family)
MVTIGITFYEVYNMLKEHLAKEAIFFIVMAVLTLIFGIYYLSNPFPDSLCYLLLKLFGLTY